MNKLQKLNEIISVLRETKTNDLVALWNSYIEEADRMRDCIHKNCESIIVDLYKNPWELLTALGDYNVNDDYFVFGLYGYINSFNYIDDENSPYDIDELADWLLDNNAYWEGLGIKNDIDK